MTKERLTPADALFLHLEDDSTHMHVASVTIFEGSVDYTEAVQEVRRDGATPVITFKHVRGVTKGMDVAWTFEPMADRVRVQIWHGFDPPWPLVGNFVADRVIGPHFVEAIAGKTLATIKMRTESTCR